MKRPIHALEEFYAHAIAIEREAARSYREFERHFAERGEDVLAGFCRNLAHLEEHHYHQLLRRSLDLRLPAIDAADYLWMGTDPPENLPRECVLRVATPRQLLEIALAAEHAARRFFESVAASTTSQAVRAVALEMAAEESEHVRWVLAVIEYLPRDGETPGP